MSELHVDEVASDIGERFDPFCHTLDDDNRALCLADISGRRVHNRVFGTSGSAAPTHCPTCQKALCPTCTEVERQAGIYEPRGDWPR